MARRRAIHPLCRDELAAGTREPNRPADRTNNHSKRDGCEVRLIVGALGGSLQRRLLSPLKMRRWTPETDKAARNGGYLCSGRSLASGGRFRQEPVLVSRGGELCVERRCSRIGGCGCLACTDVMDRTPTLTNQPQANPERFLPDSPREHSLHGVKFVVSVALASERGDTAPGEPAGSVPSTTRFRR